MKSLFNGARNILSLGYQKIVFGNTRGHARGIALLKSIGTDRPRRHLAGDDHHGYGIQISITQWGHDVGGRRTASHHSYPGAASGMGIPFGHMARTLLVAHQYMADRRINNRVIHRQNSATGQAEHHLYTLEFEGSDEGLTTV